MTAYLLPMRKMPCKFEANSKVASIVTSDTLIDLNIQSEGDAVNPKLFLTADYENEASHESFYQECDRSEPHSGGINSITG